MATSLADLLAPLDDLRGPISPWPAPDAAHPSMPQRGERRCRARSSRTGEPCRNRPMLGGFVCGAHGGRAPAVRAAAQRRLQEEHVYRLAAELHRRRVELGRARDAAWREALCDGFLSVEERARYLTQAEAAEYLGVLPRQVRRQTAAGELVAYRGFRGRPLYLKKDLARRRRKLVAAEECAPE